VVCPFTIEDLEYFPTATDNYLAHRPVGEVFSALTGVIFGPYDGVMPDVLYVSNERSVIIGTKCIQGAPDWVVEVLSPSTEDYDLKTKRTLYRNYGIRLYWVVDPEQRVVHVFEFEGDNELT